MQRMSDYGTNDVRPEHRAQEGNRYNKGRDESGYGVESDSCAMAEGVASKIGVDAFLPDRPDFLEHVAAALPL
jgi:hypothetical protein